MLTKKVQDSLSKHVVTMDALKKAKEGYTDQFQLDFDELFRVFLTEQEKREKGHKTYIPEKKAKPPKRNISKEKRDRMVNYGYKVTGNKPIDYKCKKPDVRKVDFDDMMNRAMKDRSDFGKIVAFQQS